MNSKSGQGADHLSRAGQIDQGEGNRGREDVSVMLHLHPPCRDITMRIWLSLLLPGVPTGIQSQRGQEADHVSCGFRIGQGA